MRRLADIGEHMIIRSLVSRYLGAPSDRVLVGIGDDAALFAPLQGNAELTVTVDACPTPVVDLLGVGSMADWGRLAGVISLSDLAAMGARSLGLLSSTYMPPEMLCADYEAYLRGLDDVCREFDTPIVGGNIREGTPFAATTVALGSCPPERAFSRSGCRPEDVLIAVGQPGLFWSGVLELLAGGSVGALSDDQRRALFEPVPRLREALVLRDTDLVTAAVDCSDGLGAGVAEIARSSGVGVVVRFGGFPVDPAVARAAADHGVAVERLLLAWGDWQLLAAVRPGDVAAAMRALEENGHRGYVVGEASAALGLYEEWPNRFETRPLLDSLASVRFESTSYLHHGLDGYVRRLRKASGA